MPLSSRRAVNAGEVNGFDCFFLFVKLELTSYFGSIKIYKDMHWTPQNCVDVVDMHGHFLAQV